MAEAPVPDGETVQRIRQIFMGAAEQLLERNVPSSDVMYGLMVVALEIARLEIGPAMVVEWLRNTADLQERQLLESGT